MNGWKRRILRSESGQKNLEERRRFNSMLLSGGGKNKRKLKEGSHAPSLMKYRWAQRAFFCTDAKCKLHGGKCRHLQWKSPFHTEEWVTNPFPEECIDDLCRKQEGNAYQPQFNGAKYVLESYVESKGIPWNSKLQNFRKKWNKTHDECHQTSRCTEHKCKNSVVHMHANDVIHNLWVQKDQMAITAGGKRKNKKCDLKKVADRRILDVFSGREHFVEKNLKYVMDQDFLLSLGFPLKEKHNPINVVDSFRRMKKHLGKSYDNDNGLQKQYGDKIGWVFIYGKRPDPSCMNYVEYSEWAGYNPCTSKKPEHDESYQKQIWTHLENELRKRNLNRANPPKSFKGGVKCKVCKKEHFIHKIENAWRYSLQEAEPATLDNISGNLRNLIDEEELQEPDQFAFDCYLAYSDLVKNWRDMMLRYFSSKNTQVKVENTQFGYTKPTSLFNNIFEKGEKVKDAIELSKERMDFDKKMFNYFFEEKIKMLKAKLSLFRNAYPDKNNFVGLPMVGAKNKQIYIKGILVSDTHYIPYAEENANIVEIKQDKLPIQDLNKTLSTTKKYMFLDTDTLHTITDNVLGITGGTDGAVYKMTKRI
jgi:hypothetical protein